MHARIHARTHAWLSQTLLQPPPSVVVESGIQGIVQVLNSYEMKDDLKKAGKSPGLFVLFIF
jgi:hypothetical protein